MWEALYRRNLAVDATLNESLFIHCQVQMQRPNLSRDKELHSVKANHSQVVMNHTYRGHKLLKTHMQSMVNLQGLVAGRKTCHVGCQPHAKMQTSISSGVALLSHQRWDTPGARSVSSGASRRSQWSNGKPNNKLLDGLDSERGTLFGVDLGDNQLLLQQMSNAKMKNLNEFNQENLKGNTQGCQPHAKTQANTQKSSMSSGVALLHHHRWFNPGARSVSSVAATQSLCSKQVEGPCLESATQFTVELGDNQLLLQHINSEQIKNQNEFDEQTMKIRYHKYVRPQLQARGLILPLDLAHGSTQFVHHRTREIVDHRPIYMSSYDIMEQESRMTKEEWDLFLKYMIKIRVYIIEEWNSLSAVESLMYDHGIISPDDGTGVEFFKAECDASFKAKKAQLSFIIWKGRVIFWSQVYRDVDCDSSVFAEAFAAIACLLKARELKIDKLVLWTDSQSNYGVLSGEKNIKYQDKHRAVYMMIRSLKKDFNRLVPVWKPRELLQFPDDLVSREDPLDPMFPKFALIRWANHLKGLHLFRVKQKKEIEEITNKFVDDQSYGVDPPSSVVLEVEIDLKFDGLVGLIDGFEPSKFNVAVHRFKQKPEELRLKFKEFFSEKKELEFDEVTIFSSEPAVDNNLAEVTSDDGETPLMILFDADLCRKRLNRCQLTVILAAPHEIATMVRIQNMPRLSAVTYACFKRKQ